jgi:hypothetical protein
VNSLERFVRLERERVQREEAAFDTVRALSPGERRAVLARLIDAEGFGEAPAGRSDPAEAPAAAPNSATSKRPEQLTLPVRSESTAPGSSEPPSPREGYANDVDKVAALLRAHPVGMSTADVAVMIGQLAPVAAGALKLAVEMGTVRHRSGRWWPLVVETTVQKPRKKRTVRQLILQIYAENENRPFSPADLFHRARAIEPATSRSSIDGEISRMKLSRLLDVVGDSGRGATYAPFKQTE